LGTFYRWLRQGTKLNEKGIRPTVELGILSAPTKEMEAYIVVLRVKQ
jgi:hypothetical protein